MLYILISKGTHEEMCIYGTKVLLTNICFLLREILFAPTESSMNCKQVKLTLIKVALIMPHDEL